MRDFDIISCHESQPPQPHEHGKKSRQQAHTEDSLSPSRKRRQVPATREKENSVFQKVCEDLRLLHLSLKADREDLRVLQVRRVTEDTSMVKLQQRVIVLEAKNADTVQAKKIDRMNDTVTQLQKKIASLDRVNDTVTQLQEEIASLREREISRCRREQLLQRSGILADQTMSSLRRRHATRHSEDDGENGLLGCFGISHDAFGCGE